MHIFQESTLSGAMVARKVMVRGEECDSLVELREGLYFLWLHVVWCEGSGTRPLLRVVEGMQGVTGQGHLT